MSRFFRLVETRCTRLLEGVEQTLSMEGLNRHVEVFQARRNDWH